MGVMHRGGRRQGRRECFSLCDLSVLKQWKSYQWILTHLQFLQLSLPFAAQLVVITINIQWKYHLICNVICVNLSHNTTKNQKEAIWIKGRNLLVCSKLTLLLFTVLFLAYCPHSFKRSVFSWTKKKSLGTKLSPFQSPRVSQDMIRAI